MQQEKHLAPFVAKMYEMVNNPSTNNLIRWGKQNNTFLVLEPSLFSQTLLPFYFKHSNLSSFIRQLNTYGFRKVDPDRSEFAHESFLKGQIHLLPLIVRRRKRGESDQIGRKMKRQEGNYEEEEEESLMVELGRLKKEQKALEEEIEDVNRRLQVTERKPIQIMSLLLKLAGDPCGRGSNCLAGEERKYGGCGGGEFSMAEMSSPELGPPRNVDYPFCLLGRGFLY
ncbi:heat stress transcription factor C-1a-like [Phalaenopsis equestris]|uniref:heat stress transcription factor C-1a-like n=1 Tax=Phalaenopsis equestris TaxID=78828 RepID=UPI0009E35C97|nr:heat stress transcription factor C-1a-like [Phalaenopsis equestris]